MTLNSSLQMTSAVFEVCPFTQEEFFRLYRAPEYELFVRLRSHDAVLHFIEFNVQNLSQVLLVQCAENNDLINSVHELGRELAFRNIHSRVVELLINLGQAGLILLHAGNESDSACKHLGHFDCAEIRRHKDDAAREIDFSIVA